MTYLGRASHIAGTRLVPANGKFRDRGETRRWPVSCFDSVALT
jgi:hypothetical protein